MGLCGYAAVWLWTDWDWEIKKGIERNIEEAGRRELCVWWVKSAG